MHAKLRERRQVARLVEEVQVVECELLRDRLIHFDRSHVLLALGVVVGRQGDGALACLSVDLEVGGAVLGRDSHRLRELRQILADLAPLARVNRDERMVLGVRDGQVLNIEAQQVKLELGASASLGVLKLNLQKARISISLQGN